MSSNGLGKEESSCKPTGRPSSNLFVKQKPQRLGNWHWKRRVRTTSGEVAAGWLGSRLQDLHPMPGAGFCCCSGGSALGCCPGNQAGEDLKRTAVSSHTQGLQLLFPLDSQTLEARSGPSRQGTEEWKTELRGFLRQWTRKVSDSEGQSPPALYKQPAPEQAGSKSNPGQSLQAETASPRPQY